MMKQVILRYRVPEDHAFFALSIPQGGAVLAVSKKSLGEELYEVAVLVDPMQASADEVSFFQVEANEEFETEGLEFVGLIGHKRFLWMKRKRSPIMSERSLQ